MLRQFFAARICAALILGVALTGASIAGPNQVSSGSADFETLGISSNGRFVLYQDTSTCNVYRADRELDATLLVLEEGVSGYSWCNGAKLSNDGNLVAAAPLQNVSGICEQIVEDENGTLLCDLGLLTELVIKDLTTGELTEVSRRIYSRNAGDIGRIPGSGPTNPYLAYGVTLVDFAGNGNHAITSSLNVLGGVVQTDFRLIDVVAGSNVVIAPPLGSDEASVLISAVSLSNDGNRLALLASIATPPDADCDSTISPDPQQAAYWNYYYNSGCQPDLEGPDVFIWDRAQATVTNLTADAGATDLPAADAPVISGDGMHAAWFKVAAVCSQPDANGIQILALCDGAGDVCQNDACEPTVVLADLAAGTRQIVSVPEADTNVCAATNRPFGFGLDANLDGIVDATNAYATCALSLADDGGHLLYAREIVHPFGDDWSAEPLAYKCLDRAALESGEELFVDCPESSGTGPIFNPGIPTTGPLPDDGLNNYFNSPINNSVNGDPLTTGPLSGSYWGFGYPDPALIGASFRGPLAWYLYDAGREHTTLVSLKDDGDLLHANGGQLAGDGSAWTYNSRDPRLQGLAEDEVDLAAECFWSPPGVSSSLRISTNDNTTLGAGTDAIVVYPELPAFCPIPDPALSQQVYAADLGNGVNLAVITWRDWRQGPGSVQTWLGNFAPTAATHVTLTLTIAGLNADASILIDDPACAVYPPDAADETHVVRCEYGALNKYDIQALRWQVNNSTSQYVSVTSSIAGNDIELAPQNNSATSRIMLRRPGWLDWLLNISRSRR